MGTKEFAKMEMSGNVLQKIIFKMVSGISSSIEGMTVYKQIRRTIRRSVNLENLDFRIAVKKYLTKQLRKISTTITVEKINALAHDNIISAVKHTRSNLQNASIIILKGIDQVKTPLEKYKYVTDPIGYVKSLPKLTINQLQTGMVAKKPVLLSELYILENKIRHLYMKTIELLRKHSQVPNELVSRFKNVYKNVTSKYFDMALGYLDKYNEEIVNHLKAHSIINGGNKLMKKQLQIMSQKTKTLKTKYAAIRRKFIVEMKHNLTMILTNEDTFKSINENIFESITKGVDTEALKKVMLNLKKDLKQIVNDALYPHIQFAVSAIDNTVCTLKRNISKFYKKENGIHMFSWNVPGVLKQLMKLEKLQKQYVEILVRLNKK